MLSLLRFLSTRLAGSGERSTFLSFAKIVAFFSVFLGSAALVLSLSVLEGFEHTLHHIAESMSSHAQLRTVGTLSFSDKMRLFKALPGLSADISSVSPTISINALVLAHGVTEGITLKSFAKADDLTSRFHANVVEGSPQFRSEKGVALGHRLASRLACHVGDTILLSLAAADDIHDLSSMRIVPVHVASIYKTGMTQYDDVYIYAPFSFCASVIDTVRCMPLYAEIMLRDIRRLTVVKSNLEERCRNAVEIVTVNDIHQGMFSWIEIQKKPIPLVIGLISIVAVFTIVTTLLISIVEKTRSLAVLRTLGLSSKSLLGIVSWQGFTLGFAGSVSGALVADILLLVQQQFGLLRLDGSIYFVDTLPVSINAVHSIIVVSIATCISLIATLIPGVIATRISPVGALRFH